MYWLRCGKGVSDANSRGGEYEVVPILDLAAWRSTMEFSKLSLWLWVVGSEFNGARFTWCDNQLGERNIIEWLDRAVCNYKFLEVYQRVQGFHLDAIEWDRCPVLIDFQFVERKTPRSFKFESYWIQHSDFKCIVEQGWNYGVMESGELGFDIGTGSNGELVRFLVWYGRGQVLFFLNNLVRKVLWICFE